MAVDKELKFKFVVDQTSLNEAKRVVEDLISSFSRLQAQAQQAVGPAQKLVSGISGGGTGIASTEAGKATLPIAGTAAATSTQKLTIGGAGGLISSSFTKLINEHNNLYKNIAKGGQEGMNFMSIALKKAVNEQTQEIDRLKKFLADLREEYKLTGQEISRLEGGGKGTGRLKEHAEALEKRGLEGEVKLQQTQKALADLQRIQSGSGFFAQLGAKGMGGGGSQGAGISALLTGAGRFLGGMGGNMATVGGLLGTAGGFLGNIPVRGVAGLAGAAVAAGLYHTEVMNDPNRFSSLAATRGQIFAPQIQAAYSGDIRPAMALADIISDPMTRKDYEDLDSPYRRFAYSTKGFLSGLTNLDVSEMGRAVTGRTASDLIIQERNRQVEQKQQSDPLRQMLIGDITSNYMGRIGAMRALGIGDVTAGQAARGGRLASANFRAMEAALQAGGYSLGEAAGTLGAIESGGTRAAAYGKGGLLFSALNAQAGGLQNAAQFSGMMSRFGMGTGRNFLEAARVMGGENDVAVANTIASFVAQQAAAQNVAGITGLGSMGMLSTGLVGRSPENRMIAEQNIRGFGALQNLVSGNLDPYQQARNLQTAMGAAPGAGVYAQDYLATRMNLTQMADVLSGQGQLSPIARSLGVTPEMVQKQFRGVTASTMERLISDPMMANTSMAKTLTAIQESGMDPREWFKSQKGKKGFNEKQVMADYAAGLLMTGQAPDEASAEGLSRAILKGAGARGRTEGKKVGDVSGYSMEMQQAKEAAEKLKLQTGVLLTEMEKINGYIQTETEHLKRLADLGTQQEKTQQDVIDAMAQYELAIRLIATGEAKTAKEAFEKAGKIQAQEKAAAQKKGEYNILEETRKVFEQNIKNLFPK